MYNHTAILRIIDSVALVFSQAIQLARVRLASAASPISRMMAEWDHALTETQLLRRELAILHGQRETMPPHRRPDNTPEHRLAILQLMRLRDWSVAIVAKRFVLHPNTVRAWYNAYRVHAALGAMTPNEAAHHDPIEPPIPIRQRDSYQPAINITRHPCRGDPYLPFIDIRV